MILRSSIFLSLWFFLLAGISIATASTAQRTHTYDNAGRMTVQQLVNGTTITRQHAYEYYPAASPWAGLLKKVTDPRGIETTVEYDDYLRVENEVSVGTANEHEMTRAFEYDRRGILKQVIQNYGNLLRTELTSYVVADF